MRREKGFLILTTSHINMVIPAEAAAKVVVMAT